MRRAFGWAALMAMGVVGCSDEDPGPPTEAQQILAVPETGRRQIPGLTGEVHVVRTEHDIPHVYAENRIDMGYALGFVTARDRYFMMDLARRLGQGRIGELLGDSALEIDQESRGTGMTLVAQRIEESLDGELAAYVDAFAEGINAYIRAAQNDEVDPPSELQLAQGLLGASSPTELMQPFERIDVAAMVAVILYQSSFETGDVGRAARAAALDEAFAGAPFETLRRAGAQQDMWGRIAPLYAISSSQVTPPQAFTMGPPAASNVPTSVLDRLAERLDRFENRFGRDVDAGFGSNAWAVDAAHTTDGSALMGGDGHLSLAVPSILWRFGLDLQAFGGLPFRQAGMSIAGFPLIAIGTNGKVAWSQTQLGGDITDWYAEELELDADGRPVRSRFGGEFRDLTAVDETYVLADVPLLESEGRTETWTRWTTFDGRFIADIEGRVATADEALAAGETLVNLQGSYVVPGDENGDGVVSAVSFDYAGFDAGHVLQAADAISTAESVEDYAEGARGLVGYSQNFAVADNSGDILYGAFQAFPCRDYLPRDESGFAPGADPNLLLDGTTYGGFTIPIGEDGVVDHASSEPYACAVPHEALPQVQTPPTGYVSTANNDLGGTSLDGSITNDPHYLGGPWDDGHRQKTIVDRLEEAIADGTADVATMADIQGDHSSPLGRLFTERLVASIDYAKGLASPTEPADQRVAALYQADAAAMDEVATRLRGWSERGFEAASGVVTNYHPELAPDETEDAVATMIFNAWLPRVLQGTFDDEAQFFFDSGSQGRVHLLSDMLQSRGDNALGLASYDPTLGESVFFDVLDTPEVESSHEVVVGALSGALAFLRSTPDDEAETGTGGFGTGDMNVWLWGMRHQVRFDSLLAEFLGDNPELASLTERFAITTAILPLAEGIPPGDPRFGLKWFPRPGDQYAVDAANPGFSGTSFSYSSGPVMRLVISLKGDEVSGVNVIPGGQSAITESPYFADQAQLWLGNEVTPLRFSVAQVVAGATGREVYTP